MDLYVIEDWEQVIKIEDGEETPTGPFNKWEKTVGHPIEQRMYKVDLKKLDTHWRMRVFWNTIRDGHRWMKAIHPSDHHDADEAMFIADKHLHRYFEEQLALYNAVCIIHLGQKFSDECGCDDCDHSQHLRTEQQPLLPYAGADFPRRCQLVEKEGDICDMCAGKIDIEAYIKANLCPYCKEPIPKSQEEYDAALEKRGVEFKQEYEAYIKTRKGRIN